MNPARLRQITRLEKLAEPYLKGKQQIDRQRELIRYGAVAHATVLAFLIRYGNPNIDEPLSSACLRCAQSDAWKECCGQFPLLKRRHEYVFDPYNRDRVLLIGTTLRYAVISSFPGADEKQKLTNALVSSAPWFIWYTFGDYTAALLDLAIPDLSKISGFARSKQNFDLWWGLPHSTFERQRWPRNQKLEPLAYTDLNLLRPKMECVETEITTRELKREHSARIKTSPGTGKWPPLVPAEFLIKMPPLLMLPEESRRLIYESGFSSFGIWSTNSKIRAFPFVCLES